MNLNYLISKPFHALIAAIVLATAAVYLLVAGASADDVESGVYRIINKSARGSLSMGTGFKVAQPGVLVTNYHVVRNADALFALYRQGDELEKVRLRIMWHDRQQDLAILRGLTPIPGAVLTLADIAEDDLKKRDVVEAIGYPGAADNLATISAKGQINVAQATAILTDATVSTGTVQRQVPGSSRLTIQHSANVNSGNSGGPLLDSCHRVIGVNTLSQTAQIRFNDIANAAKGNGVVEFQTPGALESSVHVREVLAALQEENVAANLSSGRCRSGKTPGRLWALGTLSTLSFALFSLTSLAVMMRQRNMAPYGSAASHSAAFSGADGVAIDDVATDNVGRTVIANPTPDPVATVQLIGKDGTSHDLTALLKRNGPAGVLLGRDIRDADIAIDDASVSRRHARIECHASGDVMIRDLGSTNGIRMDGCHLPTDQSVLLHDGAQVTLGTCAFTVSIGRQAPRPNTASTWILSGFDAEGRVFQHPVTSTGQSVAPGALAEVASIGRAPDNDCPIDHPSVSRHHAALVIDAAGRLCVVDRNSSNGTFVDGRRVADDPLPVENVRELRFGDVKTSLSHTH
ncbi:FHA domain-containing protein [Breoghania sp.]|uniref:FHA domain-containing protein n=1 Tax=Breoghania sp. TaxID=2065378 RepID=UPI002AAB6883|nr:FHA domain-containing protein [Breoghania sp.]